MLDDELAQAELARHQMKTDDFYDQALQQMMDGVLEVRWEDEIKKDPKKPRCLELGLHPKNYTDDDLKSIAAYEQKIIELNNERARYHDILLAEKEKMQTELNDNILAFNKTVAEVFRKKLQMDFAIKSEELKSLNFLKFNFERVKFQRKEETLL